MYDLRRNFAGALDKNYEQTLGSGPVHVDPEILAELRAKLDAVQRENRILQAENAGLQYRVTHMRPHLVGAGGLLTPKVSRNFFTVIKRLV